MHLEQGLFGRRSSPNAFCYRPTGARAAIDAVAEDLPSENDAFVASMAIFTVHQWRDLERGLAELRRVKPGTVVIMTCDPASVKTIQERTQLVVGKLSVINH